jgi:hypothetical protein
MAKRIEDEFNSSGGKDLLLKSVAMADAVTRGFGHWLHESGAAGALHKMAEAERAMNERVLGKDLLFKDPIREMDRLDRMLNPKWDGLKSSASSISSKIWWHELRLDYLQGLKDASHVAERIEPALSVARREASAVRYHQRRFRRCLRTRAQRLVAPLGFASQRGPRARHPRGGAEPPFPAA